MTRLRGATADTLAVLAAALSVRLALLLEISGTPLFLHPPVDAAWHHEWASLVASGDVLAYAPFFRAPLYPWLLGAWYAVAGSSVQAGALLSLAVSVAGCLILHRTALLFTGRRAALAAALCWSLWAPAVFQSSALLIEPLYITLLISSLFLLRRGGPSWAALLMGLAAIARPGALLLIPTLFIPAGRRRYLRILPALAPAALVWGVNALAGDPGVFISSQGGINLYLGNAAEADGMTAFAPRPPDGTVVRPDNVWSASVLGAPRGSSESAVSGYWTERALVSALDDPSRWAALTARKALLLLSPVEIPGNYDLYYMRGSSLVLRVLLLPPPWCLPFSFILLLLPQMLASGRADGGDRLLSAWIVLLLAGVLPFFVTGRFRLPSIPFILLLYARRLPRRSFGLIPLSAGLAIAAGGSIASSGLAGRSGVNMPFQDALAHVEEGREAEAEALFLMSLDRSSLRPDLNMNRVEAMHDLGLLAARRGDLEEAGEWWRAALELAPGFAPSREALEALP